MKNETSPVAALYLLSRMEHDAALDLIQKLERRDVEALALAGVGMAGFTQDTALEVTLRAIDEAIR